MARKIKFPLEMKNGNRVRTLEELKENFDLEKVLTYFQNKKLHRWLYDRGYNEELRRVNKLTREEENFEKLVCDICKVDYLKYFKVLEKSLMETNIPVKLVANLKEVNYDFIAAWSYKLYDTIFESILYLLAFMKRKNEKNAVVINDERGKLLLAVILEDYSQINENLIEKKLKFVFTFNQEDLKEVSNRKYITEKEYFDIFKIQGKKLYNLRLDGDLSCVIQYTIIAISTLIDDIEVNAKYGSIYKVYEEKHFVASSIRKNGKIILSINLDDSLKKLIISSIDYEKNIECSIKDLIDLDNNEYKYNKPIGIYSFKNNF